MLGNENTENNKVALSTNVFFCKRPTYVTLICIHEVAISAYSRNDKS